MTPGAGLFPRIYRQLEYILPTYPCLPFSKPNIGETASSYFHSHLQALRERVSEQGYQYQLLINGIPAFQPHVVVERHEKVKEIDQNVKQALLKTAQGCAEMALASYLGASPQFAKIASPLLETVEN